MVLQLNDSVFFKVDGEYEFGVIERFSDRFNAIVLADNDQRYLLRVSDIHKI